MRLRVPGPSRAGTLDALLGAKPTTQPPTPRTKDNTKDAPEAQALVDECRQRRALQRLDGYGAVDVQ